jgi:predicted metal-dependent hydrolase
LKLLRDWQRQQLRAAISPLIEQWEPAIGERLEYIVVHEMTHLLERGYGERFVNLMDGFLPNWRTRRDELNDAPLSHQEWPQR